MADYPEKSFLQSIHGKVIAAFLIGVAAVALSWVVMQVGFREMLQTVNKLSAPNEKLRIVNNLSYQIIQLEQLQRANVIRNPEKPGNAYHSETANFIASLDTLRQLSLGNKLQVQRIDSMELILLQHKELADQYFGLRADWSKNLALSKRVAYLSDIIANVKPVADSSVVTTSKKITTTTIIPSETDSLVLEEPKQSFFSRLFGSKKTVAKPRQLLKQIQEELNVQIDTLSVARQDSSIYEVEKVMRRIEKDYLQRRAHILDRELALIKSSSRLHTQMLNLLHAIEAEELSFGRIRNKNASEVVTASLERMNLITVGFFLGAALLVFLIFLDISRRDKYRKALQLAKEEAENLGQVKQRFLANMSHELRTPLQSIIGFADQILEQEKPQKEAVKAIHQSSEHLLQIVNEVLDYSRIVSGKFTFEEKPFELKKLATEVITTLQLQAQKKNLQLQFMFENSAAQHVVGDPFRMRQVLYNLLGNAIKFTPEGFVKLTVKCLGKGEKPFFSFLVQDSGIGISEKDQQRIFNQFEQASAVSPENYSGTGLGLSIVKALVESQGGYLTVKSKPGQGSVFEVQLPFVTSGISETEMKTVPEKTLQDFAGKVLVVDDDAFILELCATILNKNGIKNFCYNSSQKLLQQELPEELRFVFLDIRMPEISGLELCKILREKLGPEVKIFALTAQALPEEKATILMHGFDGILRKPFREKELLQLLKRYAFSPKKSEKTVEKNFAALRQMTGNDEAIFQKILAQFISETTSDLELLELALLKDETGENAAEIVHRLTARTGQMGDLQLSKKLRKLENKLRSEIAFENLKPEIKSVSEAINQMILLAEAEKTVGETA
ncbi:hybrid sensor histidine kinase/response regulator [Adhaeribacter terreus]|uniref:histidine kinase n=1 Tax=Adhaeribacter terreus TaxID=529703 RepID=A0ABW0E9I6_9BACT